MIINSIYAFILILNSYNVGDIQVNNYPILTENRINLTRIYVKKHYGLNNPILINPKMIVVHYTATRTIQETFLIFKPDELKNTRPDIADGGTLNVGVHFLIDQDVGIWSLLPVNIIGRHTIGYNHVSIGIELVGMSGQSLTDQQLESCSSLVAGLCNQFRTIEYLIGHHEYMKKNLPHFLLFEELDSSYHPAVKSDPGDNFMRMLRTQLKKKYNLKLMN